MTETLYSGINEPLSSIYVPTIIEETGRERRQWDPFSRLLKDRVIFIGSMINDDVANLITAQLLYLQMEDSKKDIHIYIQSPGGYVTAGMAIYDTMQHISCDIATYCIGQAASMGAVLLAAGSKGKRFALPNARIMIHQPLGGAQGQASDISIQAQEIIRTKKRLNEILAYHTGQKYEKIDADTDRDRFLSAEEAAEYGLVDKVLESKKTEGLKSLDPSSKGKESSSSKK